MPVSASEIYDEIKDAPNAVFDMPGDRYIGEVVYAEWHDDSKYSGEQIPKIVLRLEKLFNADEYATILCRSKLLQREIGKAVKRAGAYDVLVGGRLSIELTELVSTDKDSPLRVYAVTYTAPLEDADADMEGAPF
jgi:hypothetical protein